MNIKRVLCYFGRHDMEQVRPVVPNPGSTLYACRRCGYRILAIYRNTL